MTKSQKKKLQQKVSETLPKIVEKHNKRRRIKRLDWETVYSKKAMPAEHWQALESKAKSKKMKPPECV